MSKNRNGITLIALVVTIIVLLILAGVSIITLTGDNGIITRTQQAKQSSEEAAAKEKVKLAVQAARIHGNSYSDLTVKDVKDALAYENIAVTGSKFPLTATSGLYQFTIDANGNISKTVPVVITLKTSTGNIDINEENASTYYGREIKNYTTTGEKYRLFYIDFANDFGDGEGTIYLKADYSEDNKMGLTLYDTANKPETLIKKMNPEWAKTTNRGNEVETKWNDNEKAAAWLCQPTRNSSAGLWKDFYDTTNPDVSGKINYIIGSPSVDMFIKSYNAVSAHTTKLDFAYSTTSTAGYRFKPTSDSNLDNGYGKFSSTNSVATDCDNMYCTPSESCCLASPAAGNATAICSVYGYNACLTFTSFSSTYGVCPLVSLQSSFVPELKN